MDAQVNFSRVQNESDWSALCDSVRRGPSETLPDILRLFRDLGAETLISEGVYIDRDFSAAYAAFYAALFEPYQKYCRRWHFFVGDLTGLAQERPLELARGLEAAASRYLGYIVIRPVAAAPVGSAVVAAEAIASQGSIEVSVRAKYDIHLLGATLPLTGVPVTQQDTRVGACAQSAIWTIGRHFTARHGGSWFSLPDITDLALRPMDSWVARSLPEGSEFLSPDNMVRALRAMDRHPIVIARTDFTDPDSWAQRPQDVILNYLDSGIPVIIGLAPQGGSAIGHAVVAVGHQSHEPSIDEINLPTEPGTAANTQYFLINDDQRGICRRLPIQPPEAGYPWSLTNDCLYLIVPLPSKVYFKAEVATPIARALLSQVVNGRDAIVNSFGLNPDDLCLLPGELNAAMIMNKLVARTYLTFGWKYKERALRNAVSEELKEELLPKQFPRYVWVTEFSSPHEVFALNPCHRKVRAHVVLDATGNPHSECYLVIDTPGLLIHVNHPPSGGRTIIARISQDTGGYYGKIRGQPDFSHCVMPAE